MSRDDLIAEIITAIVFLTAGIVFVIIHESLPDVSWISNAAGITLGMTLGKLVFVLVQTVRDKK